MPGGGGVEFIAMKRYFSLFVVVTLAVVVGTLLVRWLLDGSGEVAQRALAPASNQARGPVGFAQLPPAPL